MSQVLERIFERLRVGDFSSGCRGALGKGALVALLLAPSGCVTVRPQQRAILADPIMQFDGRKSDRNLDHVLENREGSFGGGAVQGGGCGCN
jgi:hypothetical protein